MIWKNKYKKRRRRKQKILNKIQFLNFKTKINNSYRILLWVISILIFYSIVQYNFFNSYENKDYRSWNRNQIKELNLSELYKLKDLDNADVSIYVLNYTNQTGLARRIGECFQVGYDRGDQKIRGDYEVLKHGNFDGNWSATKKTQIFVHVDTINNPKFILDVKKFLEFTGYNNSIVTYTDDKREALERDITIKLGEDWDESSNLVLCGIPIN